MLSFLFNRPQFFVSHFWAIQQELLKRFVISFFIFHRQDNQFDPLSGEIPGQINMDTTIDYISVLFDDLHVFSSQKLHENILALPETGGW